MSFCQPCLAFPSDVCCSMHVQQLREVVLQRASDDCCVSFADDAQLRQHYSTWLAFLRPFGPGSLWTFTGPLSASGIVVVFVVVFLVLFLAMPSAKRQCKLPFVSARVAAVFLSGTLSPGDELKWAYALKEIQGLDPFEIDSSLAPQVARVSNLLLGSS